VDEAGRGPWAGPVVAAAVILHRANLPVRIDDSKRLTARQRASAFTVIEANADVGFGIVCADMIDQRNILQATLYAMHVAIAHLPVTPDLALIDGNVIPPSPVPCRALVRGDQRSYVISCASIMSKVLRDSLMVFYDRLAPRYGFKRHKGYGTPFHAQQLQRYGPCVFHRESFRPVRDAKAA
jgi:ribonuclease HII